jgi:hypothetical protein
MNTAHQLGRWRWVAALPTGCSNPHWSPSNYEPSDGSMTIAGGDYADKCVNNSPLNSTHPLVDVGDTPTTKHETNLRELETSAVDESLSATQKQWGGLACDVPP